MQSKTESHNARLIHPMYTGERLKHMRFFFTLLEITVNFFYILHKFHYIPGPNLSEAPGPSEAY